MNKIDTFLSDIHEIFRKHELVIDVHGDRVGYIRSLNPSTPQEKPIAILHGDCHDWSEYE